MKIDKILSGLRQTQDTTKEASAAPVPAVKAAAADSPRDALVGALNDALTSDKVASEKSSPVSDVMKVAEEMAGIEHDARVKEAQVMGAAFADAFVARLGVWQSKAAELNQSAQFGKVASADAGMLAQAQHMGYSQTKEALEQQAKVAYEQGYNDTVNAIHEAASGEFLKGAAVMSLVLDAVRQG
jgi:hypothetical protein